MSHHFLVIIHLFCAAIWVGGHLLLVFASYLPKALKKKIGTSFWSIKKNTNR